MADVLARIAKHDRAQAGRRAGGKRKPGAEDRSEATAASKRSTPTQQRARAKAAKANRVSEARVRRMRAIRQQRPDLAQRAAQCRDGVVI